MAELDKSIKILVFNVVQEEAGFSPAVQEQEIASFLATLNPKPDFLLLQEFRMVENDRISFNLPKYIQDALGKTYRHKQSRKKRGRHPRSFTMKTAA